MSREQIWELEENKRSLLRQAYRMKQECPHMSPVGLEYEPDCSCLQRLRTALQKKNQYENKKKSFHPGLQMKAFFAMMRRE